MKQNLLLVAVALLALIVGFAARRQFQGTVASSAEPALSFAYPDLDGKMQAVSQWRGKILVINFWASWCGPCKQEIPEFIALQQQYAGQGVQFVGIAIDDREPVSAFLQQVKINYPILLAGDTGITLSRELGNIVGVLPFSVVVNQQGQIVHRQLGELSKNDLIGVIEPLLAGK